MDEAFEGIPVLWVMEGSVAARAGVRQGDRVLIANGVAMSDWDAYAEARSLDDEKVSLTVQRGNEILELVLVFDRHDSRSQPISDA